jgi:large subunit ribosomal protein L10e
MFTMGQSQGTGKDYEYQLFLHSEFDQQISHLALEAGRIATNRYLRDKIGRENYFFRVLVYPHHVVREHRMMAFAGADRLQDGMRKAFGKPFATAARVRRGQKLMSVKVNKVHLKAAEIALKRARYKFPRASYIQIHSLKTKAPN